MYRLWFANIPCLSENTRNMFYEEYIGAKELYGMREGEIRKIPWLTREDAGRIIEARRTWRLEEEWRIFMESGVGFVTLEDEDYPGKLRGIPRAPYALYYLGSLPGADKKSVAIVGARGASPYGSQVARALAARLAEADVDVISGMALGIDADGHTGALSAGGRTYAVLGCGVDVCYPAQNKYLYENIPATGGILSEYPVHTAPQAWRFPPRNRIISGLSDCTVVIEARKKSGSLITADYALEQGRQVYALPGRITDELSEGCNRLILQGAGAVISVEDFMRELELIPMDGCVQIDFRKNLLEKDERLVYSLFDFAPLGIGTLVQRSPFGLSEMLDILGRLEQKGWIYEKIPNYYIKKL